MGPQDALLVSFVFILITSLSNILRRKLNYPNLPDHVALAGTVLLLILISTIRDGVYRPLIDSPLPVVELKVDKFSRFLASIISILAVPSLIYSFSYIREENRASYYTLLLLLVTGLIGSVFSNDLFTFYCFWELASISAYSLVGFRWWHWEPAEASFKYLLACTVGALTALYSTSLLYGITGTTNLDELSRILSRVGGSQVIAMSAALMIIGLGTTAAAAPFHMWLPDAHSAAPNPISALLSGVVVKVPLYMLTRLLLSVLPFTNGLSYALTVLGVASSLLGNLAALIQNDVKRFLAYSTIANVGYIFTGIGACYRLLMIGVTELAIDTAAGALSHLAVHALSKGLLFLCVGNVIEEVGSRFFASLEGYGRRMPFTAAFSIVALVGLSGIPPLVGYYGKSLLTAGIAYRLEDPFSLIVLALVEANFALAAGIYAYFVFRMFKGRFHISREASKTALLSEFFLAAIIVFLSLQPSLLVEEARACAKTVLPR